MRGFAKREKEIFVSILAGASVSAMLVLGFAAPASLISLSSENSFFEKHLDSGSLIF
jgi:hypothetical protein